MTRTPQTTIYEVIINPFRTELAIYKADGNKSTLNLQSKVVVQIEKEIFIGQISNIKLLPSVSSYVSSNPPQAYTRSAPSTLLSETEPNINCHIMRLATEDDLSHRQMLNKKNEETKTFFEYLLKKFKLSAKVVLVDWDFSEHKVYCYLTAERKVNYLLLHETAVDSLKARVAIKQIGVRDFARSIGGLGVCGRELCCRAFLHNIQSVTLTMARQQNIYIEPEKISGCCGKLRCCIIYEQDTNDTSRQRGEYKTKKI